MLRLNVILLLVVVICSLGVVTSQHKARQLFQALEVQQERKRQLDVEFGQLQLELSTWGTAPRIVNFPFRPTENSILLWLLR